MRQRAVMPDRGVKDLYRTAETDGTFRPKAYAGHRTLQHSICPVGPLFQKQNPTVFDACTVTVIAV